MKYLETGTLCGGGGLVPPRDVRHLWRLDGRAPPLVLADALLFLLLRLVDACAYVTHSRLAAG